MLKGIFSGGTYLLKSSTCKGTFSAPSGGSLPNKYELLGFGDDAYFGMLDISGELFSSLPTDEERDDECESTVGTAMMGEDGETD